jgi:small nuclear ribonucleoprotein (snRNP)-like protein
MDMKTLMESYPDFIYDTKNKTVIIESTGQFIVSSSEVRKDGELLPEYFVDINEVKKYLQYYNIKGTVGTQI